ncbi:MAG: hypothetical protein ABFD96_06125 [Armatimonadia bacterium]
MRLHRFHSTTPEQPIIYLDLDQVRALEPGPNGSTRVILDSQVWEDVTMAIDEVAALINLWDPAEPQVTTLPADELIALGNAARANELMMLKRFMSIGWDVAGLEGYIANRLRAVAPTEAN